MVEDVRKNYLIFLRGGMIRHHPKYILGYWIEYPDGKVGNNMSDKTFYDKYLVKK